jgi:hypothetical protein
VTTQERNDQLNAERADACRASGEQRTTRASSAVRKGAGSAQRTHAGAMSGNVAAKVLRAMSEKTEIRLDISLGTDQKYIALPDIGAEDNTMLRSLLQSSTLQACSCRCGCSKSLYH